MKYALLGTLILLCTCVRAQAYFDVDQSVKVTAQVDANTPQITVSWIQDPRSLGYDLYRRKYADDSWGDKIASYTHEVSQYIDANVQPQTLYEYKVVKYVEGVEGYGYVLSGIAVPPVHQAGEALLVLTNRTSAQVSEEVQNFQDILSTDGWPTRQLVIEDGLTSLEVKAAILSAYQTRPFTALLLLGDVPVPYSGDIKPDGHPNHRGAWSADIFYGDLDGVWTDTEVSISQAEFSLNHNVPGDGKWDQSFIPSDVDIAVGRVDFSNLPVFMDDEFTLLRRYLAKDIAYRTKEVAIGQRAAMRNTNPWLGALGQNGIRNFSPLVGPENITYDEWEAVFEGSYLWYYGSGGGSQTMVGGLGSSLVYSLRDFQGVFTAWFGSYFGDYHFENNYMRTVLGSGTTLSAVWAGAPHWHFHSMAMGFPLAHATVVTQNNDTIYTADFFPRSIHVNLLGDPTLKAQVLSPPKNLRATEGRGFVDLQWSPSAETVESYYLYRRTEQEQPYTLLGAVAAGTTTYRDSCQEAGTIYHYLVRSAKLATTPSGSFVNLSAGSQTSVTIAMPYQAIARFTADLQDSVLTLRSTSVNAASTTWLLPDGSTATTPETTYILQPGEEALIQLVAANACSQDTASQFLVYTSLPSFSAPALQVFPNPVTDRLTVRTEVPFKDVALYHSAGQQVFYQNVLGKELTKNLEKFPAGVYLLRIRFKDSLVFRKIVISGH